MLRIVQEHSIHLSPTHAPVRKLCRHTDHMLADRRNTRGDVGTVGGHPGSTLPHPQETPPREPPTGYRHPDLVRRLAAHLTGRRIHLPPFGGGDRPGRTQELGLGRGAVGGARGRRESDGC